MIFLFDPTPECPNVTDTQTQTCWLCSKISDFYVQTENFKLFNLFSYTGYLFTLERCTLSVFFCNGLSYFHQLVFLSWNFYCAKINTFIIYASDPRSIIQFINVVVVWPQVFADFAQDMQSSYDTTRKEFFLLLNLALKTAKNTVNLNPAVGLGSFNWISGLHLSYHHSR